MDSTTEGGGGGGLLAKRKNRNKKGLLLGAEAAKPGTLSGTSAAQLLAAPLAPPIPSRPGQPIQVSGSSRSSNRASIESSGLVGSSYLTSPAESPLLPTTPSLSSSSTASSSRSRGLSERLADLELGVEFKLDLRNEDLQVISELGCGNGGTVSRALHVPTKVVMAKKASRRRSLHCQSTKLTVRRCLSTCRSFTSLLLKTLGNKSYENYKSCTTVLHLISFPSTEPTCKIHIFACAWNLWIKGN